MYEESVDITDTERSREASVHILGMERRKKNLEYDCLTKIIDILYRYRYRYIYIYI